MVPISSSYPHTIYVVIPRVFIVRREAHTGEGYLGAEPQSHKDIETRGHRCIEPLERLLEAILETLVRVPTLYPYIYKMKVCAAAVLTTDCYQESLFCAAGVRKIYFYKYKGRLRGPYINRDSLLFHLLQGLGESCTLTQFWNA